MAPSKSWLKCLAPCDSARLRLVCFPHAGGSAAAYRVWPKMLGPEIEVYAVQYPGRAERYNEPFVDDMQIAVALIIEEVAQLLDKPYAFFGHSMGGAIAHEAACLLMQRGLPLPEHLFVSGRQPPLHHFRGTVHAMDDAGLADELLRLSSANRDLFSEPELAELMLPIIRSDYRLIERYAPGDPVKLPIPITALFGSEDDEVTVEQEQDWGGYTQRGASVRQFPGDHFFLVDKCTEVTELVASTLLHRAYNIPIGEKHD